MIINPNEIIQGMTTQEKHIKLNVANDFWGLLKRISASISELNQQSTEPTLREQTYIIEKEIHTEIIKEMNKNEQLVDLEKLGFLNVNPESIEYLLTAKDEIVEEYKVNILTVFFEYEEQSTTYQVLLPLYLIQDNNGLYLLKMKTENSIVQSSLEKIKNS